MSDLDRYQYGYDQNSNRLYKANVVGTAAVGGLDEAYAYDNLNRLTQMQRGNLSGGAITGTPSREMDYTLDPTGNWAAYLTKTNGTTDLNQTRTANKVNEITAIGGTPAWATPPAYDAAGNMTSFPQPASPSSNFTATYDAWNRMVSVSSGGSSVATYQYDGRGRRIVKNAVATSETRHFYYTDNWQDIEERTGTSTSMDKQYVWGVRYIDELVCRDDVTPQRLYAMQDANFNLTSISDTSGSVVERYLFDPYGTRTIMNASWSVISVSAYDWVVGHQGLMHDEEDGLVFDRRRYINPVMGRFMTHDPIGYRDGLNLYEYERSNPADLIDPFGLTSSGCCCGLDVTSWYVDEIKYWQQRIADDEYAMFFFSWRFILAKESPLLDYKYRNFSGSTNEPNTITLCGKCLPKDQLGNIMYGIIAQELDLVEAARNYGHGHGPGTWIYNGPKTPWGKARFKETGFDLGVLLESQFENGTPVDVNHLCSAVNAKVFNSSNKNPLDNNTPQKPCTKAYTGPNTTDNQNPKADPSGN